MYVYGACCYYDCCSDDMGVCGNVFCVAADVKASAFLALECRNMLYVYVMDVVIYVCIVMRGAVGARVWEV